MSLAHILGIIADGVATTINANVAMAAAMGTSVTVPSHASGDYLVAFAYRDGFNTAPTVPGGWTALSPTGLVGANTNSAVLAYKVAASGSETCSGWTNATGVVVAVVKVGGAGPLGLGTDTNVTYGNAGGSPFAIDYTGLTPSNNNGHSIILAFGGQRDTTGSFNVAVSDMTIGAYAVGSAIIGGHYTTHGVSSFATHSCPIAGSGSSGYASATVEITGAA